MNAFRYAWNDKNYSLLNRTNFLANPLELGDSTVCIGK